MPQRPVLIAFDAYGTLLSTASISSQLETFYGADDAAKIAALWRRYQLEYTWRINSMGVYQPFSNITEAALSHAAREVGQVITSLQSITLMKAYNSLSVFPDVPAALSTLEKTVATGTVEGAIFSNGTRDMVHASLSQSADFKASYGLVEKKVVLIDEMPEETRKYKPAPETYSYLAEQTGRSLGDLWLVTSNPFDVVGAAAAGIKTAWVDRVGAGWVDGLGGVVGLEEPTIVTKGVDAALKEILTKEGINV